MKTKKEIEKKLKKVESDERLHYPTADVFSNAPLALIQVSLESQRDILKWILSNET